jgi:hypothetical protein
MQERSGAGTPSVFSAYKRCSPGPASDPTLRTEVRPTVNPEGRLVVSEPGDGLRGPRIGYRPMARSSCALVILDRPGMPLRFAS